MNAQELMQQVVKRIEAQDFDGALALLTDDFTFSGAVPQPISGKEWMGVHRALAAAMPDLRFNYLAAGGQNDTAEGTVSLAGTHTGELVLPIPGIPRVPATGKKIVWPKEPVRATTRADKLSNWRVESVPGGGIPGMLKQMGVALPH
jgi:SnoaL-like domain